MTVLKTLRSAPTHIERVLRGEYSSPALRWAQRLLLTALSLALLNAAYRKLRDPGAFEMGTRGPAFVPFSLFVFAVVAAVLAWGPLFVPVGERRSTGARARRSQPRARRRP